MLESNNKYTEMQRNQYEYDASNWSLENRDPVVGSFDAHNNWRDYDDYLFRDIRKPLSDLVMLDFGCGPGRNIVKFNNQFNRIDGVDLAQGNIDAAKKWISANNCKLGNLYKNNGVDLQDIPNESYDVIMSTICFQHICVHEIRKNYMYEFYKKLRFGGVLTMQMGFGGKLYAPTTDYYENNYEALVTNGGLDTNIWNSDQLKFDLYHAGFSNFNYYVRPTGPGDNHSHWIFFNVTK